MTPKLEQEFLKVEERVRNGISRYANPGNLAGLDEEWAELSAVHAERRALCAKLRVKVEALPPGLYHICAPTQAAEEAKD